MPDIFLSYTHADAERARQFAEALEAEGFEVWWDAALRSGEVFDKVTEEALREAKAVVVLWSKNSVESRWVRAEATEAERENKLVPAMIDGCKRPIRFELTHTAELSHWNGNRSDPAWRAYVEDLHQLVGLTAGRKAPQVPIEVAAPNLRPRPLIWVVGAGIVLAAAAAGWLLLGRAVPDSAVAADRADRIPVLVRTFGAGASGDRNATELASGLSDELIVRLRQVPGLRIGGEGVAAGTNGVFAGAYVVDGNVRQDGDRVRVTAALLNHAGEVVWSQSYDRTMSDLFAMQEQIASAIANALSVSLDVGANSSKYGGTDNPDAFAAFMQFKAHEFSFDQSVPQGYLERAIALDPNYLKALSALSASYSPQLAYAATKQQQQALLAKMDASTAKMLSANPNVWMSHFSRAVYYGTRGDFLASKKESDLAQSFDQKNDPELPGGLATLNFILGYSTKASQFVESAEIIDPTYRYDPDVIRAYLYTGRYKQAIELFEQLAQQGNEGRFNHSLEVFWAYMLSGREADAMAFVNRDGRPFGQQALAIKADKVLPTLTMDELRNWAAAKYGEGKQFDIANAALAASYYGKTDLAVNLMRLAYERPGGVAALNTWQPAFAAARKTDGFKKLMSDVGFVKLWRTSGDWGDFCKPTTGDDFACH